MHQWDQASYRITGSQVIWLSQLDCQKTWIWPLNLVRTFHCGGFCDLCAQSWFPQQMLASA